jgi:protein-disulfide isomerase
MSFARAFAFVALSLLLAALTLARPTTAADASLPQDRAALDQAIHDYLTAHPDVVLDALKAAQQQADAQAAEQSRRTIVTKKKELFESSDDLVQGNPKGDVTVVEFFDYRCPYCKQVEPSLDALLKEDTKLRIVYKEFPILGDTSVYAAHVALAAKKQGKYAEFHRALMATKGDIAPETVMNVAASVHRSRQSAQGYRRAAQERLAAPNLGRGRRFQHHGERDVVAGHEVRPFDEAEDPG